MRARIGFKTKLTLLFGGIMALVVLALAGVALWRIDRVAESRVQEGIREAERVFLEARETFETSARDAVDTLAASNPEIRSVLLSLASPGESDLFGSAPASGSGSDSGSGDGALRDAHQILASSMPFLPMFQRNALFAVLSAKGILLLDKSRPDRFGDSLGSIPLVSKALAGEPAYGWWNAADTAFRDQGLFPSSSSLYQVIAVPVRFSGQTVGLVLVGSVLDQPFLARFEKAARAKISVLHSGGIPVSAFGAGELDLLRKLGLSDASPIRFTTAGESYLAARVGTADEGFLVARSKTREMEPFSALQLQLIAVAAFALAAAIGVAFFAAQWVTRPLALLSHAVTEIGRGNFEFRVRHRSGDEFERLGGLVNSMAEGLAEREKIKRTFRNYVSDQVVDELLGDLDGVRLGREQREITAFFSDIASFTSHAERMTPESVVSFLNEYLGAMSEAIEGQRGLIDKYIGDAIMAFWGAPVRAEDHANRACAAALAQARKLDERAREWQERYRLPDLSIRMGIATGEALVGNVGSERRMNYTIIGDTVNLASRLEGLNKAYGTRICISEDTRRAIDARFLVRELDRVRVKGKNLPVSVYELMGIAGEDPSLDLLVSDYDSALSLYRQRRFSDAILALHKCARGSEIDPAARVFLSRCEEYIAVPPAPDWDGVWTHHEK